MPLPSSDLRQPVCVEMKSMTTMNDPCPPYGENILEAYDSQNFSSITAGEFSERPREIIRPSSQQGKTEPKNDMGSVDSSDTYASCNTHPFLSEGDLTSDIVNQSSDVVDFVLDSNIYINPLDLPPDDGSKVVRGLKKSASGDTAFRNLIGSPTEDVFGNFTRTPERGSRGSLNDSPVPKHRKTRFQQGVKPRIKHGDACERSSKKDSQESLEGKREKYLPTKGLVSASRIINQHLFGLQSLRSGKGGKNSDSRSSAESIDSRSSPNLEQHRRSKSILKKPESSHQRFVDPETEKLISDSTSAGSVSLSIERDISSSSDGPRGNINPLASSRGTSPPVSLMLSQKYQVIAGLKGVRPKSEAKSHAMPIKFVGLTPESTRPKSPLLVFDDLWGEEKHSRDTESLENRYKDRLETISCIAAAGEVGCCGQSSQQSPLYICPPPPPMNDNLSKEESKLVPRDRSRPLS